jgi:hypothetical protein
MKHLKFWLPALCMVFAGCSKDPGVGGKATIKGKVKVVEYNDNTCLPTGNEYYGPEERVYIIYGDNGFYDDDIRTGPDGSFEFRWLRKGDYTIFVYSDCPSGGCPNPCPSGVKTVSVKVSIDNNKEELELSDIVIDNW